MPGAGSEVVPYQQLRSSGAKNQRGTAIVGHDRVDEFLVVRFVVWFVTIQGCDSRDCLTPQHLSVLRDAKFTRPVNVRHPTIERADKLAQR